LSRILSCQIINIYLQVSIEALSNASLTQWWLHPTLPPTSA